MPSRIVSGNATVSGPITLRPLAARNSVFIQNLGPGTLYVGGVGVTTANGFPLGKGERIDFTHEPSSAIGVTSTGNCDVRYVEESFVT